VVVTDITELILADHETFRRQFGALDVLGRDAPLAALREIWDPLAGLLETHASAEETIFYPTLVRRGDDGPDETEDAIGDHNEIRDGVHDAAQEEVGSTAWWAAVQRTREANDEHLEEEESDGIPDFRKHTAAAERERLGVEFAAYERDHSGARGFDRADKDPKAYVEAAEQDEGRSQVK